jgi:hypothetical protein
MAVHVRVSQSFPYACSLLGARERVFQLFLEPARFDQVCRGQIGASRLGRVHNSSGEVELGTGVEDQPEKPGLESYRPDRCVFPACRLKLGLAGRYEIYSRSLRSQATAFHEGTEASSEQESSG